LVEFCGEAWARAADDAEALPLWEALRGKEPHQRVKHDLELLERLAAPLPFFRMFRPASLAPLLKVHAPYTEATLLLDLHRARQSTLHVSHRAAFQGISALQPNVGSSARWNAAPSLHAR